MQFSFRVTLIYFIFAILWITTTDRVLEWFVQDTVLLTQLQTVKGLLYVTLTAIGLYYMMKSYEWFISKSKEKLEKQERSLNIALNSARMAVWEYDPDKDVYLKSENHNNLFGLDEKHEINLRDIIDRVHPDDKEEFKTVADEILSEGSDFDIKYRVLLPDGTIKWLWSKGESHSEDGELATVSGVTIDITENKYLEDELAREQELQSLILNNIPVMITVYRPKGLEFKVNSEFEKVTGWNNRELQEVDILKEIYPDEKLRNEVIEFMKNPGSGWKDLKMVIRSGDEIMSSWTNVLLSDETQVGIGIDITERKELERKIDSERKDLQKIFDSMPVFINVHNEESRISDVNKYFRERLGYTFSDIENQDLLKIITTSEDYERAVNEISKSDGAWADFELITKQGKKIQSIWTNIKISEDRSLGIGVDITERKELENKLRQNEEFVSLSTKSANVGKWEWHPETGEVRLDETWANLVGYTIEELEPVNIETWNNLVHPDDYQIFEKAVNDYITGRKSLYECEVRMKHKKGHWVHILDRGKAIEWDENGNPVRMVGTHIDISDRIAYEESLAYHASLLANVSDAVISLDKDFKIVSWNHAAEQIYGWNKEEAIGQTLDKLISTDYESGTDDQQAFEILERNGHWQGEVTQTDKNGEDVHIFSSVTLIRDSDGGISDIIAVNSDITERKKYERENSLLANVFKKSNTALAVSTHDSGKLERVNQAYADLFGYKPEEMIGMDVYKKIYPEGELQNESMRREWIDEHGFISFESILKRKDGSEFYGIVNLSVVREGENEREYRIATVQDISDLKKIQNQIAHERMRFEVAANLVSDVVWEWNPIEEELWWGEGIETVMGYSRQDCEDSPHFWQEHIYEADRKAVIDSMKSAEVNGVSEWEHDYRFLAADGSLRRVSDSAVIIRDENGRIVRIIGAMVDVTQMIEYQEALSHERNRFELIARSANDVLYEWSLDTDDIWWSEGWVHRFDYVKTDVEPTLNWWKERIHPDDRRVVLESINKAVSDKEDAWSEKYRFLNGKGEYLIVLDKGFFVKNDEGTPVQLVGTISDITPDEMSKLELKKSEQQYRLLFEKSPIPMYIYDPETLGIITVNQAAISRYGYSESEFKGMKIYELHPQEELEDIMAEIKKSLRKKSTGFDVWNQVTRSGERLIVELSGSQIFYEDDIQRLVIAKDVTEQRLAERRLKASEEQYRLLFEQNPIPMWIYDPEDYGFTAINNAAQNKYGYAEEEFLSMTIFDLHRKEEVEDVRKSSEKNRKTGSITFTESKHLTKSGKQLTVEIAASNILYKEKNQRLVLANDITEQRKAEERAISAILEGEERERQRIAKELHDGLGQYLSAANMNLKTVFEDAVSLPEPLEQTFNNGLKLLSYAISETRNISQNLLPQAIQDYGLELALESLMNQLKGHNDINFHLYQKIGDVDIPDNVQINLYRIAQEAISNAIRHGKPENINIQNIFSQGELLLTIEDDGIGFDVDNIRTGGIGLQSMKTRVGAMAANLDIISTIGRGTIISIIIPLKNNIS